MSKLFGQQRGLSSLLRPVIVNVCELSLKVALVPLASESKLICCAKNGWLSRSSNTCTISWLLQVAKHVSDLHPATASAFVAATTEAFKVIGTEIYNRQNTVGKSLAERGINPPILKLPFIDSNRPK
jgi:hypothetical protein